MRESDTLGIPTSGMEIEPLQLGAKATIAWCPATHEEPVATSSDAGGCHVLYICSATPLCTATLVLQ